MRKRIFLIPIVLFIALLSTAPHVYAAPSAAGGNRQEITDQLTIHDSTDVIVVLEHTSTAAPGTPTARAGIDATQDAFLARVPGVAVSHRLESLPMLVMTLTSEQDLLTLERERSVRHIVPVREMELMLAQSVPLINADDVHANGYTGLGTTVAVLDSGIDTNHPDFPTGTILDEKCFDVTFSPNCPSSSDGGLTGDSAEDYESHGTWVSGVITSDGNVASVGVAPDAQIVAIRLGSNDGDGFYSSDTLAGLDWLITNHGTLGTDVANLSLGVVGVSFNDVGSCEAFDPANTAAHDALTALGVTNVAASGNSGITNGISFPACVGSVISVGATYSEFFNAGPRPKI
ncbi:MAG: S8 family serine peptidase, partial [Chloroflexi bacterium]|nr:S8 family serine peptidase [Chloroflexota bacterium]